MLFNDIVLMMRNNIFPNLPGALLLLMFSILFSTINFYSELPQNRRLSKKTARYLFLWVAFNYLFALVFLLLILPEDVKLNSINKGLFAYCLAATALPELSANIRLQLGGSSSKALDLHKYKVKVSELIFDRMDQAARDEQANCIDSLASHYSDRMDVFREKLESRMANYCFSADEQLKKKALESMVTKLDETSGKEASLRHIIGPYPEVIPWLLGSFQDDIKTFQSSLEARLMAQMFQINVQEARELIANGITTARAFIFHTLFGFQRRRLANRITIPEKRVNFLHYAVKGMRRKRLRLKFIWALLLFLLVALSVNFINILVYKRYPTYTSSSGISQRSIELPQDPSVLEKGSIEIVGQVDIQNQDDKPQTEGK